MQWGNISLLTHTGALWRRFAKWVMLMGAAAALASRALPSLGNVSAKAAMLLSLPNLRSVFRYDRLRGHPVSAQEPAHKVMAPSAARAGVQTSASVPGCYQLAFAPGLLAGCAGSPRETEAFVVHARCSGTVRSCFIFPEALVTRRWRRRILLMTANPLPWMPWCPRARYWAL